MHTGKEAHPAQSKPSDCCIDRHLRHHKRLEHMGQSCPQIAFGWLSFRVFKVTRRPLCFSKELTVPVWPDSRLLNSKDSGHYLHTVQRREEQTRKEETRAFPSQPSAAEYNGMLGEQLSDEVSKGLYPLLFVKVYLPSLCSFKDLASPGPRVHY